MALGTLTLVAASSAQGPIFYNRVTLVGDGAYPTGGTTGLLAALQALTKDQRAITAVLEEDNGGDRVVYDQTNDKVKVYDKATGAEKANASNQSGVTYKLLLQSK